MSGTDTKHLFTKIKFDGKKVHIEYAIDRNNGREPDEFSLISADRPRPEFAQAMQALAIDVLEICELPSSDESKLRVRGLTLTHTNGVRGACVTALKAIKASASPLVLNTPHLTEVPYSPTGDGSLMTSDMCARIDAVCDEAGRYLEGERAQGDLLKEAA